MGGFMCRDVGEEEVILTLFLRFMLRVGSVLGFSFI